MHRTFYRLALVVLTFSSLAFVPNDKKHSRKNSSFIDSTAIENLNAPGLSFYLISDLGFNGFYKQTEVADAMIQTAKVASPKFIISCGDNFQTNGVRSVSDPLWRVNLEDVYRHPVFNVDWFPVLGNHDYKGNTQAEIDYSQISRRWNMPDHYYTLVKHVNDSVSARLIFIDTPALLPEYRNNPEEYPDAVKQDSTQQINWLTDVLSQSQEEWILVFGHHPVYSSSPKHGSTPELITTLKPLFDKYNVDYYFCGHDHDFQHLKAEDSKVEYIVCGTAGQVRENGSDENTLFSLSHPGFAVVSFYANELDLSFIGTPGKILYHTKKLSTKNN